MFIPFYIVENDLRQIETSIIEEYNEFEDYCVVISISDNLLAKEEYS